MLVRPPLPRMLTNLKPTPHPLAQRVFYRLYSLMEQRTENHPVSPRSHSPYLIPACKLARRLWRGSSSKTMESRTRPVAGPTRHQVAQERTAGQVRKVTKRIPETHRKIGPIVRKLLFHKGFLRKAVITRSLFCIFYASPHFVTPIPDCTGQRGAHLAVGSLGLGLDRRTIH
jgi:hypothetical protein